MRLSRGAAAWAAFAPLLAIAVGLRAWKLDAIPNPCGDEGNWTWIPRDLLLHRPVDLPPDARFVPMTFARLIEASFAAFGPTFASARAVCVAGAMLGLIASFATLRAMRLPRAAWVTAWVLAVHPWSIAWSRTVSVPYAIALGTATAGSLAFLAATSCERSTVRAVAFVAATQVLAFGVHFSPLALIPMLGCAVWLVARREMRPLLRRRSTWLAAALVAPHLAYTLRGALAVAARGSTRPDHQFTAFGTRLLTYGRTVFGGLAGEATIRHFTAETLAPMLEISVVAVVIALIAAAAWPTHVSARDDNDAPALRLRAFALLQLALALVVVPLILAPARPWNLHAIDAERYLFAMLAPFAMLLGALAESASWRARFASVGFAAYLVLPATRLALGLVLGGGPDRGIYVQAGGGAYRGWRTPRERVAVAWLIQREVDRVALRTPATILLTDYAFHPIHFANAESPYPTVDVTKFPAPRRPGQRFFFVLWSTGIFDRTFEPWRDVIANDALRARMRSDYHDVVLLRAFVQPNGAPLFEVWTGIEREGLATSPCPQRSTGS